MVKAYRKKLRTLRRMDRVRFRHNMKMKSQRNRQALKRALFANAHDRGWY